MTSIIQHFSSINNAFISTIDHLPCDIIRSLWLVQSCNIALNKQKTRLDELLINLQTDPEVDHNRVMEEIIQIKDKIRILNSESVQESEALYNQIVTHKISLNEELEQLEKIYEAKRNNIQDDTMKVQLRDQLNQHYRNNPLKSQREALKEQELIKLSSGRKKSTGSSGIKLVLKIPSKSTNGLKLKVNAKNRNKIVKKKMSQPRKKARKPSKPVIEIPQIKEEEVDDNLYCFCKQPSFGDMIGCDNEKSCPNGDWFHYKCVGLLNRVDALKFTTGKQKWFCSEHCRQVVMGSKPKQDNKQNKKRKKRRSKW